MPQTPVTFTEAQIDRLLRQKHPQCPRTKSLSSMTTEHVCKIVAETTQQVEIAIVSGPGYVQIKFPPQNTNTDERMAWAAEIIALAIRAHARPVGGRSLLSDLRAPGERIEVTWPREILRASTLHPLWAYPIWGEGTVDVTVPTALDLHKTRKAFTSGKLSRTKIREMLRRPNALHIVDVSGYITERVRGDVNRRYAWQREDLAKRLLTETGAQRATE